MFVDFFYRVREAGVPATPREFLTLLEAMTTDVAGYSVDEFYYLARTALVKDEKYYDRFDQVFAELFEGLEKVDFGIDADIPEAWLRRELERLLSDEEKAAVRGISDWNELMELFRQRLAEQKERHQGGNKWIGTGGTSPFGAYGFNPAGIRVGQTESRHRRATKVWEKRNFRDLD
ncbi:MAG: VWA domain-containing protein, partial [Gammaproteobacteria bacterium]|nr:VWA domain-containing protein [Gammaproteobacteria bacterium]